MQQATFPRSGFTQRQILNDLLMEFGGVPAWRISASRDAPRKRCGLDCYGRPSPEALSHSLEEEP